MRPASSDGDKVFDNVSRIKLYFQIFRKCPAAKVWKLDYPFLLNSAKKGVFLLEIFEFFDHRKLQGEKNISKLRHASVFSTNFHFLLICEAVLRGSGQVLVVDISGLGYITVWGGTPIGCIRILKCFNSSRLTAASLI